MTFAIVAFLLGGFSISANANTTKSVPQTSKEVNWDQKLTEFEQAVNAYDEIYVQMQNDKKFAEENKVKFQQLSDSVNSLKKFIEANKDKLSKKQGARFGRICSRLKKLGIK